MFSNTKASLKWSLCFSVFSSVFNLESVGDIQLSHKASYKTVSVDCQTQTNQSCTAICGDRISSFWNHLLKWELAIDRKFLHSLGVYYRSEHSHSTKAGRDTPRWASASTRAALWKLTTYVCRSVINQPRVLTRQATSRTYDNAGGPVPRLTIHNPLLAVSVTSSLAGPSSIYPSLFVNSDEQLLELHHCNARLSLFRCDRSFSACAFIPHLSLHHPIWPTSGPATVYESSQRKIWTVILFLWLSCCSHVQGFP